jgi:acyl carrier protein
MTTITIEDRAKRAVAKQAGVDEVTNDQNLRNDLNLDSLDLIEMAIDIEVEFDLPSALSDDLVQGLTTVQSVIDLINERQRTTV